MFSNYKNLHSNPATERERLITGSRVTVAYSRDENVLKATIQPPVVSNGRAFASLLILSGLNLLNYVDRYILGSALVDVQSFFGINKSVAGLLHTLYLISFTVVAPLVGYLGDRYERKRLLLASCLTWFVSIVAGSFIPAGGFVLFALLRCLFGISSAFYECVSLPLIADYFHARSAQSRTRALFVFYMGPPLGVGLAFLIANTIRDLFPDDWRHAMQFTPIILLILTLLLVFAFQEPGRSMSDADQSLNGLKELLAKRTYALLVLSASCAVCALVGFNWWSPTYIVYNLKARSEGVEDIFEVKQYYSMVQTLAGLMGTLASAELSALHKRGFLMARVKCFDCYLLAAVLYASSLTLYVYLYFYNVNVYVDMCFYALFTFFINCWRVLVANVLLDIVDARRKAISNSILFFVMHLLGDSLAPVWLGVINDECYGRRSVDSFNYLAYCTRLSIYPLVVVSFVGASWALLATLTFQNDLVC